MSNKHFNSHSLDSKNTRRNVSKQERAAAAEAEITKTIPDMPTEAASPVEMPQNFPEYVAAVLSGQMAAFVEAQNKLENSTVNQRKMAESLLYQHYWDAEFTCAPAGGEYITKTGYTIDRSVRIDRETHKLIRATTTMLFNNHETGAMEYVATAYLTKQYTGGVMVTPLGEDGPLYREAIRVNFNMSDQEDK